MFEIAILLRFIETINKSWNSFQISGSDTKALFKKIPMVANNALFDELLLLTSVASEISILS